MKLNINFYATNAPVIEVLQIHGQEIRVRRRARQKSLRLNIHKDGRIVASANKSVPQRELIKFIIERWDWVEKTTQELRARHEKFPKLQFVDGEQLWLLGEPRTLRFEYRSQLGISIELKEPNLVVGVPMIFQGASYLSQRVRKAVTKFYKENGSRLLHQRHDAISRRTGLRGQRVTIRGQKTRWGSCSRSGTISLNWKLLFAPTDVVDYVVIHELAHLTHFNHGPKFWDLVRSHCPDYRRLRAWLRDNEDRMASF
jgi:predicted metal-dependent hydrolase